MHVYTYMHMHIQPQHRCHAFARPSRASAGSAERLWLHSAAAALLDSSITAFEGVGRDVPPQAVAALVALLAGGARGASPVSTGEAVHVTPERSHVAGRPPSEEARVAAAAAAGALWQLLGGGHVHPEAVSAELLPTL
jgi:hypothetical protein